MNSLLILFASLSLFSEKLLKKISIIGNKTAAAVATPPEVEELIEYVTGLEKGSEKDTVDSESFDAQVEIEIDLNSDNTTENPALLADKDIDSSIDEIKENISKIEDQEEKVSQDEEKIAQLIKESDDFDSKVIAPLAVQLTRNDSELEEFFKVVNTGNFDEIFDISGKIKIDSEKKWSTIGAIAAQSIWQALLTLQDYIKEHPADISKETLANVAQLRKNFTIKGAAEILSLAQVYSQKTLTTLNNAQLAFLENVTKLIEQKSILKESEQSLYNKMITNRNAAQKHIRLEAAKRDKAIEEKIKSLSKKVSTAQTLLGYFPDFLELIQKNVILLEQRLKKAWEYRKKLQENLKRAGSKFTESTDKLKERWKSTGEEYKKLQTQLAQKRAALKAAQLEVKNPISNQIDPKSFVKTPSNAWQETVKAFSEQFSTPKAQQGLSAIRVPKGYNPGTPLGQELNRAQQAFNDKLTQAHNKLKEGSVQAQQQAKQLMTEAQQLSGEISQKAQQRAQNVQEALQNKVTQLSKFIGENISTRTASNLKNFLQRIIK